MAGGSSVSDTLEPSSLPRKRPKLHPETSPISPSSKGKASMVELSVAHELDGGDGFLEPQQCGICMSEEGHAVRGCIDSCDHYFCFLCIVEWSKIESRCPLCKRRFSSIRRMRRDGSFIGDRAVIVPVRNQDYDLHGNSGPLDPYANISCTICAGSTDENLLLLCDLCDTAVHTYCAGLDATVPEGDWFCQECAQMKSEESNSKPNTGMGSLNTSDQSNPETQSVQAPISIYEIVREPRKADPEVDRLLTLFSPHQKPSLSSANAFLHQAHQNVDGAYEGSRVSMKSDSGLTQSSVRTLPRCRDVQKHIQALRENWNALRIGSLRFPSGKFYSGARNNSRVNDATGGYRFNDPRSLSSENCVRPTRQHGSLDGDTPDKYDVDRAWKMFNIAQSMKQPQKLSGTSSLTLKNPSLGVSASKNSNLLLGASSKSVPFRTKTNKFTGSKMHQSFKKPEGCESKRSEQHNSTQKSIQTDVFHGKAVMLSQEKAGQGLPYVYHQQNLSTCTTSLAESVTGASGVPLAGSLTGDSCVPLAGSRTGNSGVPYRKLQIEPASLSREVLSGQNIDAKNASEKKDCGQLLKSAAKRGSAENVSNKSKHLKFDDAKIEIQTLVKLNLTLLTLGKKLEVDKFKDVARRSTHAILAACGLEPQGHNKLPVPELVCSHKDQLQQRRKSLMPGSCSECFYIFVKDVVYSILSEKTSH